jgi:hypothetical protein
MITATYLLRNVKLYRIYMTPLMDRTGIIIIMAMLLFHGTSPTLMRTHVVTAGMGSHALKIIVSTD